MSILLAFLASFIVMAPTPTPSSAKSAITSFDCPKDISQDQVCVFTNKTRIVAVNPTDRPVRVVIQIQRIENVELVYRYPFVEELPARSSRILLEYRVVVQEKPIAFEYDWGWKGL